MGDSQNLQQIRDSGQEALVQIEHGQEALALCVCLFHIGVSVPGVLVTRPQRGGWSAVSLKFLFVDASGH